MRKTRRRALEVLLVLGIAGCEAFPTSVGSEIPVASAPTLRFDAKTLERGDNQWVFPSAMNDRGDVVGRIYTSDRRMLAYLWSGGELMVLPGLSDGSSQAFDINNRGVIVGASEDAGGRMRAVRWVDGVPDDLGTVYGDQAAALGVNDRGDIVGYNDRADVDFGWRPFFWSDGEMEVLEPGPGAGFAWAEDVNDQGVVVGSSAGGSRQQDATVWIQGVPTRLPTLGYESGASEINKRGDIIGGSVPLFTTQARAVRWDAGGIIELPTPPSESPFSFASGLNDRGQIVGLHTDVLLWDKDGYSVLPINGSPRAINNRGDIVGVVDLETVLWEATRSKAAARSIPGERMAPAGRARVHLPTEERLCIGPAIMSPRMQAAVELGGC